VLGPAEAEAAGTEADGVSRLFWRVSVSTYAHAGGLGAPVHELFEILIGLALASIERFFDQDLDNLRGGSGNLARIDFTGGSVN